MQPVQRTARLCSVLRVTSNRQIKVCSRSLQTIFLQDAEARMTRPEGLALIKADIDKTSDLAYGFIKLPKFHR